MNTAYNPKETEGRIYERWLKNNYFGAEKSAKEPFTIAIAPPNITSQLHIGHAYENTISDILIRFKRMQGYEALWVPGVDHASIATEVKIVEAMAEGGLAKQDIGREGFLKRGFEWYEEYGGRILEQFKKMGYSLDWDRVRFTMDEGLSRAVVEYFIRLHEKGYIYRAERLVGWCSSCKTTISDAEVEHEEKEGFLYYLKYPVEGGAGFIEFATTRPETILADTAVAVNPDDERFAALVGKSVTVPFVERKIAIIADYYVDKEYGTGAVKITPGHDHNDFAVGERHNLEQINILNDDGTLNALCGAYAGMTVAAARKKIVEDLKAVGLFVKADKITHSIGSHDRCGEVVEPRLKTQWFVRMAELAKPALDAYSTGELKIHPPRFGKIYSNWLTNIRDWCISRQLWWGHRIPAYHCACGEIVVSRAAPPACPSCGLLELMQDEDVLDTWFSSALWPFSTLGWPDETEDLKHFYPTQVMVMGWEIIFFWGVRMMFSGFFAAGEQPFKDLLIHGMVLDSEGRKMSKSLGNGIDPLEMIDKFGTDALRLSLITGNTPGQDFRFREEKIGNCRNFTNKLWNAARFILGCRGAHCASAELTNADKWLISSCNRLIKEVTESLEAFDTGLAASKVFDFIWNEFCDWAIEMSKPRLAEGCAAALNALRSVFLDLLRLLHPFMPFITEEIFLNMQDSEETIMLSPWPVFKDKNISPEAENAINSVKELVGAIRSIRVEKGVPPKNRITLHIVTENTGLADIFAEAAGYLKSLCGASELTISAPDENALENTNAVALVITGGMAYIPLAELVDTEAEKARLSKEKTRLEAEVARCEGRLANKNFTEKAKPHLVAEERGKLEEYRQMLTKVTDELDKINDL